jgi:hypothetical protein
MTFLRSHDPTRSGCMKAVRALTRCNNGSEPYHPRAGGFRSSAGEFKHGSNRNGGNTQSAWAGRRGDCPEADEKDTSLTRKTNHRGQEDRREAEQWQVERKGTRFPRQTHRVWIGRRWSIRSNRTLAEYRKRDVQTRKVVLFTDRCALHCGIDPYKPPISQT